MFALEKQQRHHGEWRVSTSENHESNCRGVRTMTEMIQRQRDAFFTSGEKHCFKNFTMLLRHSSWLNHLVRNDFTGCNLDILEFAFGSVLVMTDDSYAKNLCVACWHPRERSAEDRLLPSHKKRQETSDETSQVSTQKFTVLRDKNWSCKYMDDMYCDSDDNNVILFTVINTLYTCQADVDTKMTVGMFMCMTQNGEMCTVGTSTCLSCEEAPRCMSMI